jgi:hypothetical protein
MMATASVHMARIRAGTRDFVCSAAFVPEQALAHLASSRVACEGRRLRPVAFEFEQTRA